MQCSNNLKQIGLGLHNFDSTYDKLPWMGRCGDPTLTCAVPGERGNLWIYILPYIEQDNVYKLSPSPGGPGPRWPSIDDPATAATSLASKTVKVYLCPSDQSHSPSNGWGVSNYVANHDAFHIANDGGWMSNWHDPNLSYQASVGTTFRDGTSNTIGITEAYARCKDQGTLWAHEPVVPEWHAMFNDWNARGVNSKFQVMPRQDQCNVYLPQQIHPSGINALMLDGSVRHIKSGVDVNVWAAALTPNGGETLSLN